MIYNTFGNTGLEVSAVGFGAWAIGGPANVGGVPIGWGETDDNESLSALDAAYEAGINFLDTADFYGLGHSEEIIGQWLKSRRPEIVVATKVGNTIVDGKPGQDFSKQHILSAIDKSLGRLGKESIDLYQLHGPQLEVLQQGECIPVLDELKRVGKIKHWGVSLATQQPWVVGDWLLENGLGEHFQVVFNAINQQADDFIRRAAQSGYGIIARMPLQFGLLTGKFHADTRFSPDDHRSFRMPPDMLNKLLEAMVAFEPYVEQYDGNWLDFALQFDISHPAIHTTIPGIRTGAQARTNARAASAPALDPEIRTRLSGIYHDRFEALVKQFK
ncbi:MAG: aldo/keto reductase [Lentisphaeria bacterium]|nr:aldo/keto reductase [Candidatus Neomarinimicrobiota bacterium]MCF7841890.1 aldo/keto reductase [Lentisphaeria bacterium]